MTDDVCELWYLRDGVTHGVRWRPGHPLGVYVVFERWLREGVIDIVEFDACVDFVCQAANVVKEMTT